MSNTMQGKTVLITGGTNGIGRHIAIGLGRMGANLIITGRDKTRGEQGVEAIKSAAGVQNVDLLLADLSMQSEVIRLADEIKVRYPRLDVLINNVGLLEGARRLTSDGIEANLAVNVIAPYLLTTQLVDLLKASHPSQVINLTGGMPGKIDLDNLQAEKGYLGLVTYSHSKTVMMAMSLALAKQLEGTGVAVNVAYPGAADTNMTRAMTPNMVPGFIRVMWPLFKRFFNAGEESAAKAARSSIYMASAPEVQGVTGAYFYTNSKQIKWPPAVLDQRNQSAILNTVESLTAHSTREKASAELVS